MGPEFEGLSISYLPKNDASCNSTVVVHSHRTNAGTALQSLSMKSFLSKLRSGRGGTPPTHPVVADTLSLRRNPDFPPSPPSRRGRSCSCALGSPSTSLTSGAQASQDRCSFILNVSGKSGSLFLLKIENTAFIFHFKGFLAKEACGKDKSTRGVEEKIAIEMAIEPILPGRWWKRGLLFLQKLFFSLTCPRRTKKRRIR